MLLQSSQLAREMAFEKDLQHLDRLAENCRSCADFHHETHAWNCHDDDDMPYQTFEEWRHLSLTSSRLYWRCPTVRTAVDKIVCYTVGDGGTYSISAKKESERCDLQNFGVNPQETDLSDENVRRMQCVINRTMELNKWLSLDRATVRSVYRRGETIRRRRAIAPVTAGNGQAGPGFVQVQLINPYQIKPAPQLAESPFGFSVENDQPKTYFRHIRGRDNPEQIPASEIQHLKYGEIDMPRGLAPWFMTADDSHACKEIPENATMMYRARARNAVVLQHQKTTTAAKAKKLLREANKSVPSTSAHGGGPRRRRRTPGERHTSAKVEHPGANLQSQDALELLKARQRRIGLMVDLADFLVTGASDNGNRGTFKEQMGPLLIRASTERQMLGEADVEILWMALQVFFGWSEQLLAAYQMAAVIDFEFPEISTISEADLISAQCQAVECEINSRDGARRRLNYDVETVREEIERDRQTDPPVTDDDDDDEPPEDPPTPATGVSEGITLEPALVG